MNTIWFIFFFLMIISAFAMIFLSYCLIVRISGNYFDKEFHKLGVEPPFIVGVFRSEKQVRASLYMFFILFNLSAFINKHFSEKRLAKMGKRRLSILDYRALARKRDWVMAYFFCGAQFSFVIGLVPLCIVSRMLY